MKYLLLALTTVGAYGQSFGSFSSTSYDTGNYRVTTGIYTVPKPSITDEVIAAYRRMNDELSREIAESRRNFYAREQIEELKRQTRVLQEIADKK